MLYVILHGQVRSNWCGFGGPDFPTDFAMPAILGGGTQDFVANAIYDQFFRTSDQGFGSSLAVLIVIGSLQFGLFLCWLVQGH